MQKQIITINKSTENKLIKIIVVLLSIFLLLFIRVSLITLVHSPIIQPTNLFLETQFL